MDTGPLATNCPWPGQPRVFTPGISPPGGEAGHGQFLVSGSRSFLAPTLLISPLETHLNEFDDHCGREEGRMAGNVME